MEENKILRIVYTFFVGVLIAVFIGVGINAFYVPPEAPEYPAELSNIYKEPNAEQQALQTKYEQQMRTFEKNQMQPYNRNVSMITLGAAVILLAISIVFEKRIKFMADGIMLGGLFTLLYSIGRGFAGDDSRYVFAIATIGLIFVLYLGYHRFVKGAAVPAKSAK